ncbi:MAG TPA: DUF2336 domain-containing protein [Micropepsaceae bacterium]|nr:DUF2336 domain-containing protein [Micropepsaceae bacterium]
MPRAESAIPAQSRFDEIYLAVTTLFQRQRGAMPEHERNLAADILRRLSKDVEMSIRINLAEKLADDPGAPHDLLILLCDDKIEVARPILARSRALSDADLVRIIENGSETHQVVVAARPAIGETITAALARSACEAALIALLRNTSAKIGRATFEQLSERARNIPDLQGPLVERADLPRELVQRLHLWVSGALKTALAARYPEAAAALGNAIDDTTTSLQEDGPPLTGANARKLVEKLHASGQLRASFLIRVLNQGQMELFEYAFAALLNMEPETMRTALYGDNPQMVALACRAAGIDRSVFQTVFNLSRHHRQMAAKLSDSDQKQIGTIFRDVKKTEALQRLKTTAA